MKRRPLKSKMSKRVFKRYTGVHPANNIDPRKMRGGIRW